MTFNHFSHCHHHYSHFKTFTSLTNVLWNQQTLMWETRQCLNLSAKN